jgi:hypothetical protein
LYRANLTLCLWSQTPPCMSMLWCSVMFIYKISGWRLILWSSGIQHLIVCYSVLKMGTVCSSETLVLTYKTTQHHNFKDYIMDILVIFHTTTIAQKFIVLQLLTKNLSS